jgi:hypothetical protein
MRLGLTRLNAQLENLAGLRGASATSSSPAPREGGEWFSIEAAVAGRDDNEVINYKIIIVKFKIKSQGLIASIRERALV